MVSVVQSSLSLGFVGKFIVWESHIQMPLNQAMQLLILSIGVISHYFHECSEHWPSSCRWVIAEQNFHFIHQSSIFHCATASIKTSDLKTCSDGLNKSNQDLNESICLPGFLLFFPLSFLSWIFSLLAGSALSFLFAAFDLMSPHSATVLMESKC